MENRVRGRQQQPESECVVHNIISHKSRGYVQTEFWLHQPFLCFAAVNSPSDNVNFLKPNSGVSGIQRENFTSRSFFLCHGGAFSSKDF